MAMRLSKSELEIANWYWVERRTIREIAELLDVSYSHVNNELRIIRRIFRSHGRELPRYNVGKRRLEPPPMLSLPAA